MSLVGSRNAAATIGAAEAVLNALPHAVVVIGPDAKIVDANVAAEDFFAGYFETSLDQGELIAAARVPRRPGQRRRQQRGRAGRPAGRPVGAGTS